MERQNDSQEIGQELGYGGVERLVDQVEAVCVHERRRIELANEPQILGLRAELAIFAEEDGRIGERLRVAPPPGDRRSRRIKAYIAGGGAFLLTVAGFFFAHLTLDPFQLGWKSYLLCAGLAVITPLTMEKCLEEWDCRKLIRGLATVAFLAALASLMALAMVRGDLFAQELREPRPSVVVTGKSPAPSQGGNRFYREALPSLQVALAFLALAMELGAGLAFHEAKKLWIDSGENSEKLSRQRVALRERMATHLSQLTELSNEGPLFEARFWRDFHRAVLTHATRRVAGKLLVIGLCALLLGTGARAAKRPPDDVVLIDLSASVATRGPNGKTNFQKNVAAVSNLLAHLPAGARVTILGITAQSFAEPDVLLQAQVSPDPGYFGQRLNAAHRELMNAWAKRAARLTPTAQETDILGALLVASQLFHEAPATDQKVLVIFSDMRQDTPGLDLERAHLVRADAALQEVKKAGLLAELSGVEVDVLGADAAGRSAAEWESVRRFWAAYFKAANANLRAYAVLREPLKF